jgi:hypothetical protein
MPLGPGISLTQLVTGMPAGLTATQLQRAGLRLHVWAPHQYFKAALTGTNATGILCPRCKKHGRSNCLQSNGVLNYLRPVLGLERTVLLQGWSLQCIVCGEGESCVAGPARTF